MHKYFDNQEPDEEIILILRKHWFYLFAPFFLGGIIALVGFIIFFTLKSGVFIQLKENTSIIVDVIFSLLFVYVLTFSFTVWMIDYLDFLIITSKRIVVNEQSGLFKRKVSILDLDSIQDVSATEKGFVETVVGMGSLSIQTAGEHPNFEYSHIGNSEGVQDEILKAKERHIQSLNNLNTGANLKKL